MDGYTSIFGEQLDPLRGTLAAISDRTLFFIGGSPKSGTTWLQILLDNHPEIACSGETHFLDKLVPSVGKPLQDHGDALKWIRTNVFPDLDSCPALDYQDLVTLLRVAMVLMLRPKVEGKQARFIGEKTPDNVRNLDVMHCIFPGVKFVHIVRDGRDTAMSTWFHNRRLMPESDLSCTMSEFVIAGADLWVKDLDMAAAFAEAYPELYCRVRYEDLSACPSGTLRSILEFVGADTDEAVIQACIEKASFETLSGGRQRGEEDRTSFFRKGSTGDWRNHFDAETQAAFHKVAGPWLDRLGYL
jgi:hypothetical protein